MGSATFAAVFSRPKGGTVKLLLSPLAIGDNTGGGHEPARKAPGGRPKPGTLTADNQMTRKPNLALNAEIESNGRAANSARCARAFLSLCSNRDRVGLRQAVSSTTRPLSSLAQSFEANLNTAGALERYQYWSDKLERLLQQQRSRASHDRPAAISK